MANDIGPKIGLDGEKEFRDAISKINTSLKTMGTEMKLVSSEFIGNEKSMEALTKQNAVYTKEVAALNDKLALQKERLAAATKEWGEQDSRTQKLAQDVNKTQTEINKYNAKIEQNNKLMKEQSTLSQAAGVAIKGIAAAAAAAGAAMAAAVAGVVKLTKSFAQNIGVAAQAADEWGTLAKQTGISAQELQKYSYASDLIDVSVETITGSMTKLTRNMQSASKGSGTAASAFAKLGVEIKNSDGSLRDRNQVFNELIGSLGKIENVTERDAIAMEIFGKSAQELNPLILAGADALEAFGSEAERAGIVLGEDQINKLGMVSDAMARLKATGEGARNLFAAAFAEPIAAAVEKITGYVQRLTAAFAEDGLEGVLRELPKVIGELKADIEKEMPKIAEVGGQIISAIAEGLSLAVPILVPAAIEVVTGFAEAMMESDTLEMVLTAAGEIIITLATGVVKNLPMIFNTAIEVIKNLVAGLGEAIWNLIPKSATETITTFIQGIRDKFSYVFTVGSEIVGKVKEGIKAVVDKAKEWGSHLIDNFIQGIKSKWEALITAAKNTASKVKQFLGFSVPEKGPLSDADTYGPDFMKLYAEGINKNAYRVENAVRNVASNMRPNTSYEGSGGPVMTSAGAQGIGDMKIYLSTGELVGGLARTMNQRLGTAYVQDVRGSMA